MRTYFVGPWELSSATAVLPATPADGRVLLVESLGKGAALPYHRWKLVLVLASLRHFVEELRAAGFEVDHRAAPTYADGIRQHIARFAPSEVLVPEPAEWGISESLRALAAELAAATDTDGGSRTRVTLVPEQRMLVDRAWFAEWAAGRKLLRMEDFYRLQRRRLRLLIDVAGEPAGGAWNLDQANREHAKALLKHGLPAEPLRFQPDAIVDDVIALVDTMPDHWGSTGGFDLPTSRAQALEALHDFIAHRLADFGPFEDAMLHARTYLYHSRLSAAMNVGLLHPREVVDAAVQAWDEGRGTVPLQSVEGFVRQIIGWREYVNGIYWTRMPAYRDVNYFGFSRPLPAAYWEPEAIDLACVSDSVRMVRDTAYAHHIHRLMILANFATLTGVHPLRLSDWFWAAFADAFEWVELPNVVGMGTYGDGGTMSSKPYVSAAAYINRMSNYCSGCRYDPKVRTGSDACPFNYLYWTFLDDIRTRGLGVGQRMALVMKAIDQFPEAELAAMHDSRTRFLATLAPEATGWTFNADAG